MFKKFSAALLLTSALSACSAVDRLENIGEAPKLAGVAELGSGGIHEKEKARLAEIIARVNDTAQKEKRRQFAVKYVAKSVVANQKCGRCVHFIQPMYGGPACTGVDSPINPAGWCRRYRLGTLGEKPNG
jgi:hypothetical protein